MTVWALMGGLGLRALPAQAQDEAPEIIAPADKAACLACHEGDVDLHRFHPSAHGKLNCQDCHTGINQYPHPEKALAHKPTCLACHTNEATALTHSVHARANKAPAGTPLACQTCHGGKQHEIIKPSTLSKSQREAACQSCHLANARLLAGSVHGRGAAHTSRPDCLSCHGSNPHAIRAPKTDSVAQNAVCQRCHTADTAKMLANAHGKALMDSGKKLTCLACHGGNAHGIANPKQASSPTKNAMCETCHPANATALAASAHGNTDMQGASRPNCLYCHGEQFHAVIPSAHMAPTAKEAGCKSCHTDIAKRLAASVHGNVPPGKSAPSCLSCHGQGNPHAVVSPEKQDRLQKQAACERCHQDLAKDLQGSVHDRPDKQPGDHPTCLTCHGGDAHGLGHPKKLTPKERVELCARCHADTKLMARYGRTDAVAAYERTNHGRAILKLHQTKEATCVDCHGLHGILASTRPDAPTAPQHTKEICGKCHEKNMFFAYSYASHMRLQVEKTLVTPLATVTEQLIRLSPFAGLFGLLVLGGLSRGLRSRRPNWSRVLRDAYFGLGLLGILSASITLVTLRTMIALQEPVARELLLPTGWLLAVGVFALILGRAVLPLLPSDHDAGNGGAS